MKTTGRVEALKRVLSAKSAVRFSRPHKCFINSVTKKRYRGISQVVGRTAPSGSGRAAERVPGPRGRKRGSLVDRQVCLAFNGKRALRKPHIYTTKFLAALKAEGMAPVRAQVAVADPERGVATAVDAVAYRASDDACVLIELKCGFESDNKAWSERYRYTHGLQLAVTERLFRTTYPAIKNVKCRVFLVQSTGVKVHSVSKEARAAVESALAAVQVRVPKSGKKRKYGRRGAAKRVGAKSKPGVRARKARGSKVKPGGARKARGAKTSQGGKACGARLGKTAGELAAKAGGGRKRKAETGGEGGGDSKKRKRKA